MRASSNILLFTMIACGVIALTWSLSFNFSEYQQAKSLPESFTLMANATSVMLNEAIQYIGYTNWAAIGSAFIIILAMLGLGKIIYGRIISDPTQQ